MRRSSMRHSPLFAALLLALCATAAEARSVVATSNIIVRALDRPGAYVLAEAPGTRVLHVPGQFLGDANQARALRMKRANLLKQRLRARVRGQRVR